MARLRRFYLPDLPPPGADAELQGDEAAHAARVLRLKLGDSIELFDGEGGRARARITRCDRRRVAVSIAEALPGSPPPALAITLLVAPPKGKRSLMLVEKLTELGVVALRPLLTRYGEVDARGLGKELASWRRRSIEAAKQCRRDALPALLEPLSPAALPSFDGSSLYGDAAGAPVLQACSGGGARLRLAVGPEGGFDEGERSALEGLGFRPARLGQSILRIETAALALVAAALAGAEASKRPLEESA